MHPLFLGNWKMNFTDEQAVGFVESFAALFKPHSAGIADTGIAPSFLSIASVGGALRDRSLRNSILLGTQNVHWLESGAHTGEISPLMLSAAAVDFCIVGHSERRQFYGETDDAVALRAHAAVGHGFRAVVCIGETKDQYESKQTDSVVARQLEGSLSGFPKDRIERLVIAYEPVWAIGTGLAATPEIVRDVHGKIRKQLKSLFGSGADAIPILYGGSTTPDNVSNLMSQPNVNGALIGGASLKPDVFWKLIEAGRR